MHEIIVTHLTLRSIVLSAVTIVVVFAASFWLWAHYSATVFFETIRVGFVACFG